MTHFLLHNQLTTVKHEQVDLTVLEYLRRHAHKCGTKEGCASGDCGACTVVVGELHGDALHYKAINSCITFVGALHGKQLISVDDLADGDVLHPVQHAMVEHHGSQCGFCTPGFVMSLFSLYKNAPSMKAVTREVVEEYLGGNLCRCTGYKSIITAALDATRNIAPDHFSEDEAGVITALKAITTQPEHNHTSNGNGAAGFYCPTTIAELTDLLAQYPEARLLAGGTDLALEVTQQLKTLPVIIHLSAVGELDRIDEDEHSFRIGAAVNLVQCQQTLAAHYPDIASLLARFGSRQIRLSGTLVGNVANASPIGDMPPVLIALEAQLVLQCADTQRTLAARDFFIDYRKTVLQSGEFVREVWIPKPKKDDVLKIYKISKRLDDDISAVCAVFHLRLRDGTIGDPRVAFGGMAAIPKRAPACEQALRDKPLTMATITQAQQALATDFQPISDMRAGADYRMRVACNLLEKMYIELTDDTVATRVVDYTS